MQFKKNWEKCFPNSFCLRLPDQQSGYFGTSQNICDFICFVNNKLFLIECKSHAGASIPFDCIPQMRHLIKYKDIPGIISGIILFLYEKDKVLFIPASVLKDLNDLGDKSVGIRNLTDDRIIDIPSVKKRIMMDSDYSILMNIGE